MRMSRKAVSIIASNNKNCDRKRLFGRHNNYVSHLRGIMLLAILLAAGSDHAHAAPATIAVNGADLNLLWVIPFAGLLLSIAVLPLVSATFWHNHYGKVTAFWTLTFLAPFAASHGYSMALYELLHAVLLEYVPFIILIFALYTIAGGIYVQGNLRGSPVMNTALLVIGWFLASFIGTTGASMVMIRPVLRANDGRTHNAHVIVFFIFIISNIGGSLTPLGDPPLFLGFLNGVDFFWPLRFLFAPAIIVTAILLGVFFAVDSYFYSKDTRTKPGATPGSPIRIFGLLNVPLLLLLACAVLISGMDLTIGAVTIFDVEIKATSLLRDITLILLSIASLAVTPAKYRELNEFNWAPVIEVAKIFLAIFVTVIPAIAILKSGQNGAMGGLLNLITGPDGAPDNFIYFWIVGGLSGFLDNAPTYLIFFNAAGGDALSLMGPLSGTLLAISAGAVFMGANTYIGNAPNFMVKSIAEHGGVKMPSFFGYMCWSAVFLLPCFIIVSLIFFN